MARSPSPARSGRRFSVHGATGAPSRSHLILAASIEDAALRFLEDWGVDDEGEAQVMVEDCETGERRCFRVDLASGEQRPCE